MSTTNDGGPAFPHAHEDYPFQHGMSLRDWFAGQALCGLHANPRLSHEIDPHEVAEACYTIADTMLIQRDQKGDK